MRRTPVFGYLEHVMGPGIAREGLGKANLHMVAQVDCGHFWRSNGPEINGLGIRQFGLGISHTTCNPTIA
jgi:hypothetical protein